MDGPSARFPPFCLTRTLRQRDKHRKLTASAPYGKMASVRSRYNQLLLQQDSGHVQSLLLCKFKVQSSR